MKTRHWWLVGVCAWLVHFPPDLAAQVVEPEVSAYSESCGVEVRREGDGLVVAWPMERGEQGRAVLSLVSGAPLVRRMEIVTGTAVTELLRDVEPLAVLSVGTRRAPPGRPPEMSIWNVFFDKVPDRPYQTHRAELKLARVKVSSAGRRATVAVGPVKAGGFAGELQLHFYAGSRLVHLEAVVSTSEDRRAIVYEAGWTSANGGWKNVVWMDTEGRWQRRPADTAYQPVAVRYRTIIAEGEGGSVAAFPPPHAFQFPRDETDNLKFVWFGKREEPLATPMGFGMRQSPTGGKFIPWFNAPPGTQQRLGMFFLLSRGRAEEALKETLRYTHGDRFPELAGHKTFTSHYHLAHTVWAMKFLAEGKPVPVPEFVAAFKGMGVNAVHLGEFHGDGHQRDSGPLRLPELDTMFAECRRLSDAELLLIPGEEVNDFLGLKEPGKHPGHWMSLFPKPVYWVMQRKAGEPLAETHPKYGTVYRVGSREDMMELLQRERGLAWSAHPRIKASSWTPDIFRNEDFYRADFWLGGAWKSMPSDLSRERLGERVLDLLNDMANWGPRKYAPGEVDTFKIDHTHELYSHMNINYLRLARLPRYDEGWQPILDALRGGAFFTTTGEVLIKDFRVGGKRSGEELRLGADGKSEVRVDLEWTFPLRFAEIISGDGDAVYRQRIDLADTGPFGKRELRVPVDLQGRKWVRFEAWDVAVNGAYTQPVWVGGF
ncbi:MAG: hypothetical protein AB1705_00490 [Verrucomicrobiota bacterium]